MNRQEFIEKLESFGLPKSEYVIRSGGSLLLRGLREETADFDLCVSPELAESLSLVNCPRNEKGSYVPFDDVEMRANMADIPFDVVEGFNCETLESVLALKRALRRPKDIRDIAVIEEYLAAGRDTLAAGDPDRKSGKSRDLYGFMIKKGYDEAFSRLISMHMSTEYTSRRMMGYIAGRGNASPEDIADEMMAILGDIEKFKQKHISERAQEKINDFYRNWNED